MKVYLVYWCNNEAWEDYSEAVEAAFSTRDGAEASILAQGYKPHVCESEWEKNNLADWFDSDPDEWEEYESMWVKEMEVDK